MNRFEQIDIHKAREVIAAKGLTLVDIRDAESFRLAHIESAVRLSDENIADFLKTADKNKPLVCYCYHGISSQGAAEYFAENGFKEVYSIEGGFEAWKSTYPVIQE